LINLLDNAIKFSPPDKSIEIEWKVINQETGSKASANQTPDIVEPAVKISVIDQGPGVPLEDREKVFEKFYRRGNELRRETTGIGIGLSIVQHVAQALGGSIFIENDPEQRTRFTLVIPSVNQAKVKDSLS
jgi:two-component system phosphate regulon sensor histidine kinase PhoR